jgi:hypothetical protein
MGKLNVPHLARLMEGTKDARTTLERFDFYSFRRGSFKVVYAHPTCRFVVKLVPYNFAGSHEQKNHALAPPHIKPWLLPVLAQGNTHDDYGFQIQRRIDLRSCPASCTGYIDMMCDSDARNHTHAPDGTPIIFDYGQDGQWHS